MRALLILLFVFALALPHTAQCAEAGPFHGNDAVMRTLHEAVAMPADSIAPRPPKRWVAAALTVTLGAFGAQRLYLGTSVKVPLIYGLTFGGFGVLVLIDLGEILFTKNLAPFQGNNKVFMWSKGGSGSTTPP